MQYSTTSFRNWKFWGWSSPFQGWSTFVERHHNCDPALLRALLISLFFVSSFQLPCEGVTTRCFGIVNLLTAHDFFCFVASPCVKTNRIAIHPRQRNLCCSGTESIKRDCVGTLSHSYCHSFKLRAGFYKSTQPEYPYKIRPFLDLFVDWQSDKF